MRTLRLLFEYDGTDFVGWQIQRNGRTIQGEFERALKILLKEPIRPTASGRTDAGTHALGQVAHFHTDSDLPLTQIHRGLNGLLPPDIAVHAIDVVPTDFHARYSAKTKRYSYRIHPGKSALNRTQVWSYYPKLSLEPMAKAARLLYGEHDFGAFCKQDPIPKLLSCQIFDAIWSRRNTELVFEIEANRFLRHMVRIIVGTMVEIGRGTRPPEDIAMLLSSNDRTAAGATAPSCGRSLLWVAYDD